mmetsp:Transcript_17756/g.29981  ORF Transcript_17756/g.29981 Transcript_17756/m.29981 type:complete len:103 (+) Transcript_17756:1097-1405(+)
MVAAAANTLLILQSLLNNALKTNENPSDTSHGIEAQAAFRPCSLESVSSIPKGNIALDNTSTPRQMRWRKMGWEILTTRCLRLMATQPENNKAMAMITKPSA